MNLLNQVEVLFSREVQAAGTSLKVDLHPENLMIHADEKLLGQVIINLVKNSLEAIQNPGGEICIKARPDTDKNCIIQVSDNGIGIDQGAMDSVFVPSYTTKENGSGIGLSISRQIIQMHNGTISIRSEPGVETVVEIVLPAKV
jgi:signal transduction histidine kinase